MVRKDKENWTMIEISKEVVEKLKKKKIHPNQSYSDTIMRLLEKTK